MTVNDIRQILMRFVDKYSIRSIILFGSRASGTNGEDSDVDLIVEFSVPVSLLKLSQIQIEMEDVLGLSVDLIHGPLLQSDMIKVDKSVVLYAA